MGGGSTYTLIMIVVLIAVFYLFMIRPENKRKKQQDEMRSSLRKGDQITTIGGIVGRIVKVDDDTIIIETSEDRVRMELTKWSISSNETAEKAAAKAREEARAAAQSKKKK